MSYDIKTEQEKRIIVRAIDFLLERLDSLKFKSSIRSLSQEENKSHDDLMLTINGLLALARNYSSPIKDYPKYSPNDHEQTPIADVEVNIDERVSPIPEFDKRAEDIYETKATRVYKNTGGSKITHHKIPANDELPLLFPRKEVESGEEVLRVESKLLKYLQTLPSKRFYKSPFQIVNSHREEGVYKPPTFTVRMNEYSYLEVVNALCEKGYTIKDYSYSEPTERINASTHCQKTMYTLCAVKEGEEPSKDNIIEKVVEKEFGAPFDNPNKPPLQ